MTSLILPDHVAHGVYVGGARLLYHADAMRKAGITYILKLYEDAPGWEWPPDFTICENTITDGEFVSSHYLQRGVAFINEHVAAGHKVVSMCGAGISRSSTFVLAYLLERGYDLPVAWQLIIKSHPIASPHPELWKSLIAYYQLTYTLDDVI